MRELRLPGRTNSWEPAGPSELVANAVPSASSLAPGQRVEVWSNSQGRWVDATVEEIFEKGGVCDGYSMPPGCVKVASTSGIKYLTPMQFNNSVVRLASGARDQVELHKDVYPRAPMVPASRRDPIVPAPAKGWVMPTQEECRREVAASVSKEGFVRGLTIGTCLGLFVGLIVGPFVRLILTWCILMVAVAGVGILMVWMVQANGNQSADTPKYRTRGIKLSENPADEDSSSSTCSEESEPP